MTDLNARLDAIETERLHDELDLLRHQVEHLSTRPATIPAQDAPQPKGPSPWAWAYLEPEAARRRWMELAAWVDWLNARFRPGARYAIPPCWPRHGAAVEVLSALWESWKAAYLTGSDASPSTAPADWIALRLRPLRAELFDDPGWLKGCTPTRHEPLPLPPPRPDAALLAQVIATDWPTEALAPCQGEDR